MKNFLLLIALFIIPTFTIAQITLVAEDLPVHGDIFVNYVDTIPGPTIDPGLPGPDQIWDFTSLVKHDSLMQGAIDPANAFGGDNYPTADLALTSSNAVAAQFAEITADALIAIGIVVANPLGGGPLIVDLDPTQTVAKIPTIYEDNFVDDWGFVVGLPSFIDGVDSLRITNNVTAHISIDAWGTMILPDGEFEVLRRRDSTITEQIIEGLVGIFWVPVQSETSTTISYNFLAKETKGNLLTMNLFPDSGEPDQVTWVNLSDETVEIPEANFSYKIIGPPGNPSYFFTDLSTNEPDAWIWDFGDGNSSPLQNPSHQFANSGTYNVCLTASNLAGVDTYCEEISIDVSLPPVAAFEYIAEELGNYSFTDLSTNSPVTWFWDFGNGETSTEQNPNTAYSPGEYTACLTVTNAAGEDQTCQTFVVTVIQAPVADFSSTLLNYNEIQFNDLSENGPYIWGWDFGDGETSNDQNPIHFYAAEGNYNVCLTVGNVAGSDTKCNMLGIVFPATESPWEAHWSLLPNPATEYLYLTLDENQIGAQVAIYSVLGELMNSSIYQGTTQLDLSQLASGTYFVKIIKDKKLVGISKVMKQ